jgi:hypothetical protein
MKLNLISYAIMMTFATQALASDNPEDKEPRRPAAVAASTKKSIAADDFLDPDLLEAMRLSMLTSNPSAEAPTAQSLVYQNDLLSEKKPTAADDFLDPEMLEAMRLSMLTSNPSAEAPTAQSLVYQNDLLSDWTAAGNSFAELDESDFAMLNAMRLSESKFAIDLLPSDELNEIDKAVTACEDLITFMNMDSATEDAKIQARKYLNNHKDLLAETEFVQSALGGMLPRNESDINFKARMSLCFRLKALFGAAEEPKDVLPPMSDLSKLQPANVVFVKTDKIKLIGYDYFNTRCFNNQRLVRNLSDELPKDRGS